MQFRVKWRKKDINILQNDITLITGKYVALTTSTTPAVVWDT